MVTTSPTDHAELSQPELTGGEFYRRPTVQVARALLGQRLVSLIDGQLTAGWIVETEAYLSEGDAACHASRGQTPGNASMFDQAGTAYVYPIHGRHCFNVVTQSPAEGTAVLIRAVQPTQGIASMLRRRHITQLRDLCRGPARLCQAFGIDRRFDGHDLKLRKLLWIDPGNLLVSPEQIRTTERIGVTSDEHLALRFVVSSNRYASGPKRLR